ncbi:protocatechuate 3,4-dioxygenase subunit alpha [Streptomyces sp. NBC_01262]|uniref:protocatechuate 3,4-dioxygenase subunit alpha n=1 Tax=Streptomyces sp. NBC_01262 TaxID=2903803 RepID=UPI002E316574|nr:protocatechuate 3,4-dioxygenase subunit alpha [Streptomyces sp. NBC_01262]
MSPHPTQLPTPSHTIGPFYGHALPFPEGGQVAPAGHPGAINVHGYVYDGDGAPIPDALIEFWQAGPDGAIPQVPGSMRRDPSTGGFVGRDGVHFTGFGRLPTDKDGHYALRTLPPGAPEVPYISVCVFARGLTHHLYTRVYFPENGEDALLASLTPQRRGTLVADPEPNGTYRFDIHLQGDEETVFLAFD